MKKPTIVPIPLLLLSLLLLSIKLTSCLLNTATVISGTGRILASVDNEQVQQIAGILDKIDEMGLRKGEVENLRITAGFRASNSQEQAKKLRQQIVKAKIAVSTAYKSYHTLNQKCPTPNPLLSFQSFLSTTSPNQPNILPQKCPVTPIIPSSLPLFTFQAQLEAANVDLWVRQKVFQMQSLVTEHAGAQLAVCGEVWDLLKGMGMGDQGGVLGRFGESVELKKAAVYAQQQDRQLKRQSLTNSQQTHSTLTQNLHQSSPTPTPTLTSCPTLPSLFSTFITSQQTLSSLQKQLQQKQQSIQQDFKIVDQKMKELEEITKNMFGLVDRYERIVGGGGA